MSNDQKSSRPTVLDWLASKNVDVRNTFSGTVKDAGAPAAITYFDSDDTDDFYSIDIAARASEFGDWGVGQWQGRYYPVIEYHRKTKENGRLDKTVLSVGAEIERDLGSCRDNETSVLTAFCRALLVDVRFKVTRDSINNTTTRSASLLLAPFGREPGWPGSDVTTGKGETYFEWVPSFGVETYQSLPISRKIDGESVVVAPAVDETVAVSRLSVQYRPLADRLAGRLGLVVNYAYFSLLGSSSAVGASNHHVTTSLDYYLDAEKRIAFGVKYENGGSPARNFLDQQSVSVGLSLRVAP